MATRLISDRPHPSQPITVCIVSKLADIIHSNEVNPALTYDNIDPHKVLLAISTNIHQRLKTGFVVQGHIWF